MIFDAGTNLLSKNPLSFLTRRTVYVNEIPSLLTFRSKEIMTKNSKLFDIIVLAGMVVNIILAVFLILYYFDFL